ncbi:hypothetical protein ACS0TY_026514 [Phlomoides rotata]
MGEGYYNLQFSCGDDREWIFAKRTWQIKPGFLRLQRWVQDFNPYKVSSSIAQVWIRISKLPLEYWNPNIITALASAMGTVIKLDDRTASRSMGHFARVLVELDLNHDREECVMFERVGHRSVVYIQYERLLEFCNYCSIIGHSTGNCSNNHNPIQGKSKLVHSEPKVASKSDHPAGDYCTGDQSAFDTEADLRADPPMNDEVPTSLDNLVESSAGEHQDTSEPILRDSAQRVAPSSDEVVLITQATQFQVHLPPVEVDGSQDDVQIIAPLNQETEVDAHHTSEGKEAEKVEERTTIGLHNEINVEVRMPPIVMENNSTESSQDALDNTETDMVEKSRGRKAKK